MMTTALKTEGEFTTDTPLENVQEQPESTQSETGDTTSTATSAPAPSSQSDKETSADNPHKKANPAGGSHSQGATPSRRAKRPPDSRFLLLPMPADKKTNSRAGIRRSIHLSTRLSQEMYFRAYEKASNANYFLERIYPGMVSGRAGADKAVVQEGFDEIIRLWRGLYTEAEETFDGIIQKVSERLEAEGVDAEHLSTDFSEPLDEEALVTSRMDQHYLNILHKVDKTLGYISAAALYEIYADEEASKLELEVRRRMLTLYRYNIRYAFETGILLRTGKTAQMRKAEKEKQSGTATEGTNTTSSDTEQADTEAKS
jgi:hypothetical protein